MRLMEESGERKPIEEGIEPEKELNRTQSVGFVRTKKVRYNLEEVQ